MSWSMCKFYRDFKTCSSIISRNILIVSFRDVKSFLAPKAIANFCTAAENVGKDLENTLIECPINRFIPVTPDEVKTIRNSAKTFVQPPNAKLIRVAIVGSPNAGKSTIINDIMKWRVCSVSKKVHTTRLNSTSVCMKDNTQMVLYDTPGIVEMKKGRKHNLDIRMILEPEKSLDEVDLVAVIVDASNKYTNTAIDSQVKKLLSFHPNVESVLVLNKIDLLKSKKKLLQMSKHLTCGKIDGIISQKERNHVKKPEVSGAEFLEKLESEEKETEKLKEINKSGWPNFKKVFMISGLTGDGIDEFKNYLVSEAKEQSWLCNPNIVTNQSPFSLAITTVREKLLNYLPNEIPYNINLKVLVWEIDEFDGLQIVIQVQLPRNQLIKIVVGKDGKKISKIADEASQSLANTFRRDVYLKLDVVHKQLREKT